MDEQPLLNIELKDSETLSTYHLLIMYDIMDKYKSTYVNATKDFKTEQLFIESYVSKLKKDILEIVNLDSDDTNEFIKILNMNLTLNAQKIYKENKTGT